MDTKSLAKALQKDAETLDSIFPESFLIGLRTAVDSGLTCEEITSFLIIASGLCEALDSFSTDDLVARSSRIIDIVKGEKNLRVKCSRCKTEQVVCWLD